MSVSDCDDILTILSRIRRSLRRVVLIGCGDGARVLSALLQAGADAQTSCEVHVCDSVSLLADWIGVRPEEPLDGATAQALAMAAFCRAMEGIGPEASDESVVGIGCVQNPGGDRNRATGEHVFFAAQTMRRTCAGLLSVGREVWPTHSARRNSCSRSEQATFSNTLTRSILNATAWACGLPHRPAPELGESHRLTVSRVTAPATWSDLVRGKTGANCVAGPPASRSPGQPRAIFPGAFNPLHVGHVRMSQLATEILGCSVAWELSVVNVDKPMLDYIEIARRLRQFVPDQAVWLSRASTFVEKSKLFPHATFVVGADTVVRIADPRYYGGRPGACHDAITEIAANGCRFLVFGRVNAGGFRTLADLDLPCDLLGLCQEVGPEQFRVDVSSTELRRLAGKGGEAGRGHRSGTTWGSQ